MKKYTLSAKSALTTNYDTKELFVEQVVTKTVSTKRRDILLMQGSNKVIIDSDAVFNKEDLKAFTKENFTNSEIAFKRISSILHPPAYRTIF